MSLRSKTPWIVIIFISSVLGMMVSGYLTYIHFRVNFGDGNYSSLCNINEQFNCDLVAASEWSKLFGVPVAVWGFLFYLGFAVFSLAKIITKKLEALSVYFVWASLVGIGFTVFLIYLCKFVIQSWCVVCMMSWVLSLFIFLASIGSCDVPFKKHSSVIWRGFCWLFGKLPRATIATLVLIAFLAAVGFAWNKEIQKQALIKKNLPRFERLTAPVSLDGQGYGSPAPLLTILEFSDYECPYCRTLYFTLKQLAQEVKELRVIHRDYPLDQSCNPVVKRPFHQKACEAALFVRCAERQDKYWQAADAIFENQGKLRQPDFFKGLSKDLKLDANTLNLCLQDPQEKDALNKDIQSAIQNKFKGTPVILFDGTRQLVSGWGMGLLEKVVKNYIKEKKKNL